MSENGGAMVREMAEQGMDVFDAHLLMIEESESVPSSVESLPFSLIDSNCSPMEDY